MAKAYALKVRGGADTYEKWDGSTGTAGKGALVGDDLSFTLAATQDQTIVTGLEAARIANYIVRRLVPVECERLQGFPDGWTDLTGCDVEAVTAKVAGSLGYAEGSKELKTLRRKVEQWSAECPDTPRYKAMGNSMAVPVIRWLGLRIGAFDILHGDAVGL